MRTPTKMFYFSFRPISQIYFFNVSKTLEQLWNAKTICSTVSFQFYFTGASVWNITILFYFYFSFILCCTSCKSVVAMLITTFPLRLIVPWNFFQVYRFLCIFPWLKCVKSMTALEFNVNFCYVSNYLCFAWVVHRSGSLQSGFNILITVLWNWTLHFSSGQWTSMSC